MSSHLDCDLDDDPERPPPSAQPVLSQAIPATSRSSRKAVPRPIARERDARSANRVREARRSTSHVEGTAPTSARAPSPAADHSLSSNSSSNKVQNSHNPASLAKSHNAAPRPLGTVSAASPTRALFDPWNSSSTGHQRAENRLSGSTSWRDSRNLKLREQFRAGLGGGRRVADTVGAGSVDFGKDGRKENGGWERGAKGLRTWGQRSLAEVWGASKASLMAKRSSQEEQDEMCDDSRCDEQYSPFDDDAALKEENSALDSESFSKPTEKQIFEGLCFYLNGSTAPLVSDHKLKHMLAAHGAKHSIALGRRTVTHIILGTTCGGGLAASKIQKEIVRTAGKNVRFITAEWVLDSIKAQRRLAESRYSPLKLASQNQSSLIGLARPPQPSG